MGDDLTNSKFSQIEFVGELGIDAHRRHIGVIQRPKQIADGTVTLNNVRVVFDVSLPILAGG